MNKLEKIYSTVGEPASFSGAEKLYRKIKKENLGITQKQIKKWLRSNETYTKHRTARKNYARNMIIAPYIDAQWQGDLADMNNISQHNDGVKYLLVLIDVVSKYLWVEPLTSKGGPTVVAGFQRIWKKTKRRPAKLQTDDGKEFLYKGVQEMLTNMNIVFFTVKSDKKAAVAERVIKTLKEKIWKYLNYNHTRRYIDVLQDIVMSYNNTYHKSIKMAPNEVTEEREAEVLDNLYGNLWKKNEKRKEPKFKKGQMVRISHAKREFRKGYMGNWTEELFYINDIIYAKPYILYKLEDWSHDPIEGSFYEHELQLVEKDIRGYWKVEKIMETKILKNGKRKYLVKWEGYPASMNSWVAEKDIKSV